MILGGRNWTLTTRTHLELVFGSLELPYVLDDLNQQLERVVDEKNFIVDDLIGYEIVFEAILVTVVEQEGLFVHHDRFDGLGKRQLVRMSCGESADAGEFVILCLLFVQIERLLHDQPLQVQIDWQEFDVFHVFQ